MQRISDGRNYGAIKKIFRAAAAAEMDHRMSSLVLKTSSSMRDEIMFEDE